MNLTYLPLEIISQQQRRIATFFKIWMACFFLTVWLIMGMAACKTSPETAIYRSLGTIAVSVQAAANAYWVFRDDHPGAIPNELDQRLKTAYVDYQHAFAIAEQAQKIAKSAGTQVTPDVYASVQSASDKFVNLVAAATPNFHPSK